MSMAKGHELKVAEPEASEPEVNTQRATEQGMKRVPQISVTEAAALVKTGDTLLVGGFGMTGNPVHLLHALAETDTKDLTYIANNVGEAGLGGGRLLRNKQIKKAVGSFFTSNREAVQAAQEGVMEVQLIPQGSLAEGP